MQYVFNYDEVMSRYSKTSWQSLVAQDAIDHVMRNAGRDFPCMFAVRAAAEGGFHFCFAEDASGSNMAAGLTEFLLNARSIGPYATLFYSFLPEETQTLESYHDRFWGALKRLHAVDKEPWPSDIPDSMHDSDWTFCFANEPVFPLCLTPAHVKRQTRYARNFSISFQPRWTFKYHLPNAEIMKKFSRVIQEKIKSFDATPISPNLGLYGEGFLDSAKYFFHDENVSLRAPDSLR